MADRDDLAYRPDIAPPVRERMPVPDELIYERAAAALGVLREDVTDPIDSMIHRFEFLEDTAKELRSRSEFLLDKTVEDIDSYVGEMPPIVKKYVEDLTGLSFSAEGVSLALTDPVYSLPADVTKCIFRIAGYYDPKSAEKKINDLIKDWDSGKVQSFLDSKMAMAYFDSVLLGVKLLMTVLKMSYIIAIHYTYGYLCGWFRGKLKIGKKWKVAGTSFGFEFALGDMIADIFGMAERFLIGIYPINYRCNGDNEEPVNCDKVASGEETDWRRIQCCSMAPVFFEENINGQKVFKMQKCFEYWVREETLPSGSGRYICSTGNCHIRTLEPTEEEIAKARIVCENLMQRPSISGLLNPSDVNALSRALEASDAGVRMSGQAMSSLDSARPYVYTGQQNTPWDCFGMSPTKDTRQRRLDIPRKPMPVSDLPLLEKGRYLFEYMQMVDSAVAQVLEFADKIVIGTANLSKWGSSRQLCCYIYLLVLICTLVYRMIKTGGHFCSENYVDCDKCKGKGCDICNGTGKLSESQDFANALRDEFRWASKLKGSGSVQQTVAMLSIIKEIVDLFRRKMNRAVFLAGLRLPLGEMWEMIKLTISNGLSQFMDILLAPFDSVLTGMQAIPEIRHLINEECFGFDKFMKFLQCLLGNLKFGLVNEIMKFMDFTLNDIVIINDIYLSRMRMAFLDSLSKLLGNMIKLILGLRDCYDPKVLVDEILKAVDKDQYTSVQAFQEMAGSPENVRRFDECSASVLGQEPGFTEEEANTIDSTPGNIAGSMQNLGYEAIKILMNEVRGVENIPMEEMVGKEPGEIIAVIERRTGVTRKETKESLEMLVAILEGSYGA